MSKFVEEYRRLMETVAIPTHMGLALQKLLSNFYFHPTDFDEFHSKDEALLRLVNNLITERLPAAVLPTLVAACDVVCSEFDLGYAHISEYLILYSKVDDQPVALITIHPTADPVLVKQVVSATSPELLQAWTDQFVREDLVEKVRLNLLGIGQNGIETTYTEFSPDRKLNPNTAAHYYPGQMHPGLLMEKFLASDSNVLFLIGPPGTGKSSYIHQMMTTDGWVSAYSAEDQFVLEHPQLVSHIRSLHYNAKIILEDADELMRKRSEGNRHMSAILNLTSGVAPSSRKLIITTNLPHLREVDEALLRKGRTFAVLKFRHHTREEAVGLLDHLERDVKIVDTLKDDELSLGNLLVNDDLRAESASVEETVPSFGFP